MANYVCMYINCNAYLKSMNASLSLLAGFILRFEADTLQPYTEIFFCAFLLKYNAKLSLYPLPLAYGWIIMNELHAQHKLNELLRK